MSSVIGILQSLRGSLAEDGRVIAEPLARAVLEYGVDRGASANAERAYIVLRPPATEDALSALDTRARRYLGGPLPKEIVDLYREANGIWACVEREYDFDVASLAGETGYEQGIRPIEQVIQELDRELLTVTSPDGRTAARHLTVLPLLDVPDQGWHALDPWRDGDCWPVIEYWFDSVDLVGELDADRTRHPEVSEGCDVIAPDLATWLGRWLEKGCNPFFSN